MLSTLIIASTIIVPPPPAASASKNESAPVQDTEQAPQSDGEYSDAVNDLKKKEEKKKEKEEKNGEGGVPHNPMNHGGGFLTFGAGTEAFSEDSHFRYSFSGSGLFGTGIPSVGFGFQFAQVRNADRYVSDKGMSILSIPVRLGVAGEFVGVYGLFEPGVAIIQNPPNQTIEDPTASGCYEDCGDPEAAGRFRVAGGLSFLWVPWRGLMFGADATWGLLNVSITEDDSYGDTTFDTKEMVFTFQALMGWKFGR